MATLFCGTVQRIIIYFFRICYCLLQRPFRPYFTVQKGFLHLIHLKTEEQASFLLCVSSALLNAFYVLHGIEVVIYHYEEFIFLNFCFCPLLSQTKTGIALLYDEVSENAYDIRLKLMKEVLTIQKQDVVCVSGSDHSTNVSASISLCF